MSELVQRYEAAMMHNYGTPALGLVSGQGAVVVERAVGHQRRLAAEVAPQLQLRVAGAGGGHHLLVVAAEGHEAVRLGEPREAV